MEISLWNNQIQDDCINYLTKHVETSMFLLQNIEEHSFKRGDHQNSGDFYVISEEKVIKGIFTLANRGNILFQLDQDIKSQKIISFLQEREEIKITGILGENKRAFEMWELIRNSNNKLHESFSSCEVLYSLNPELKNYPDISNSNIFKEESFSTYLEFTKGFYKDQEIPDSSTDEEHKERFLYKVSHKHIWSLTEGRELVSMCALNAKYKNIAQVGGVYTPLKYRAKGYSKKCMRKLIHDCIKIHDVNKIILFTASDNYPAQKVYESLGFQRIGHYGMYLGRLD